MKTPNFIATGALCLALAFLGTVQASATAAFQVVYGPSAATGTAVADGGKITLGSASTSANQVVLWVKNTGTEVLTNVVATPSNSTDYTIAPFLSSFPFNPGNAGSFLVDLKPGVNASHKQVIHITADGLTANPYDIELNAPEVSIEQPSGTPLVSDQYVAFGKVGDPSPSTLTFTVRNIGSATLSKLQLGYYTNIGSTPYQYGDYASSGLDAHLKTLAPNGALTFTLSLKPGKNSNHDSKWYVPSNDADEGPLPNPFKIHLIAPEITVESPLGTNLIDGSSFIDFGQLVGGPTPNIATVTIKNTGSAPLNNLDVNVTGDGAAAYTAVSLPVTTLAPNASTSFTVTYDPAASEGSHAAVLDITSTDADETHFTIPLKAPEISVETSGRELVNNADYGFDTALGESRTVVFTIRNKGTSPLTNLSAAMGGVCAAEYTVFPPKATTLAPNATTTFNIKFTPAGPGPRFAYVGILSNDFSEYPFYIAFREPKIQVEEGGVALVNGKSTVDLGSLSGGPSNTVTFTVRNVGGANLTDLSTVLSGLDAADYTIGPLGATTLAPLATTTFTVTLSPTAQRAHSARFDVLSNDDGEGPFRVYLVAPEIAVEQPAGSNLTLGDDAEFGTVSLASSKTFTFTVKNKGSSPLKNLVASVDGANPSDFTVTGPAAATLAPGGKTTFTLKFAPLATGPRAAVLHLANNDAEESPFDIPLTGFGMTLTLHPSPQLVGVGESATFQVSGITNTSANGPPAFTWLKDGKPLSDPASHTAIYTIPVVALSHAGVYSCLVVDGTVSISSGSARLGVVGSATVPVTVNEGTTIALKLSEAIPPGTPAPTHQWKKNGTPFGNSGAAPAQVISGATTPSLSITKAAEGNDDIYTCLVGMDGLFKESGPYDVTVKLKPVINANSAGPFDWLVSGTVTDQITAANGPISFKFSGLPAGVTGSTTTGQLSGKPNAATTGPASFTVSATNAAGTGPVRTVGYTVAALPSAAVGPFNGLIDRSTALTGPVAGQNARGLGGALGNLVITSTGSFTGSVALEEKSHPIPAGGRLNAVAGGNPTASVVILRGTASDAVPDLTLAFTIDKNSGELTGTLSDGVTAVPVKAWHKPWLVSPKPDLTNPATAFEGSYTAALLLDPALAGTDPNAANLAYPQGTGSMTIKVEPDGDVTGGGVLADGTPVTLSTTLGPDGEIPLHFMLYTPTVAATAGSLHGWTKITAANWDSVPPFDWFKQAQLPASKTRSYKDGFARHDLTLTGGLYTPPQGVVVLGLPAVASNAKLIFSEGGIKNSTLAAAGSLAQIFTISSANKVTMPTGVANNPGVVTLTTLNAATGAIGGSFTLTDDDPRTTVSATATVTRTTPWTGVLVPRLNRGVGQFQLPKLPSTPDGTTPTTSPTLSGKVELLANP